MIDEIYNSRIGIIKTDHFSDEWEQTAIPFEESLTEEQTILYHKLCDLQSETAAAEMRAAYKAGFKDGVTLMREIAEAVGLKSASTVCRHIHSLEECSCTVRKQATENKR